MKMYLSKWIKTPWVYHSILWVGYWMIAALQTLAFYDVFSHNLMSEGIYTLAIAGCVYFNIYVLIPRFLLKKRFLLYGLLLFPIAFGLSVGANLLLYHTFAPSIFFASWQGRLVLITDMLMLVAFTTALFFIAKWRERDRYARELERQNVKSELALLKTQINPHFVFNILNTIYHLIDKNVAVAKSTLLGFSDILSHQLYDATKDSVPLEKELVYIQNFIEIERIRSGDSLELKVALPKEVNGYVIAPMLMIPLIENAFKHGKKAKGYFVYIDLWIDHAELNLKLENSLQDTAKLTKKNPNSGIGIHNVERRLELLYPNKYKLTVRRQSNCFITELTLKLDEAKMSDN